MLSIVIFFEQYIKTKPSFVPFAKDSTLKVRVVIHRYVNPDATIDLCATIVQIVPPFRVLLL
jgi:hypothetical protein